MEHLGFQFVLFIVLKFIRELSNSNCMFVGKIAQPKQPIWLFI